VVGEFVTCGHQATLHACTIGNETLIGMGATVLDGAEVGSRCIIGAHALVTKGMKVPDGSMVMGMPGKIVRQLSIAEQQSLKQWAEKYVEVSRAYLSRRK
jgi:carbonic anhydrase/acetyltransferase-like protein (isoleucine patch superfamily)